MPDQATITCSACGAPMTERINRQTLRSFLGCTRFPDCKEATSIPAYLEVKRAGGIELPGMETS